MKPIKSIKVGPTKIPVEYSDDLPGNLYVLLINDPETTIIINKRGKSRGTIVDSIFHEAIHAVSQIYDIRLKERQVAMLETTLISLIRDNPKFIKELTK